ncbi:MAG TPA: helix-turn-helix domain-containing protein [Opitutaceae bacterium]|jgi:hypothetical protein
MVTDKLKELEAAKARLEELQRVVAQQLRKELAGLPAKYGFDSIADFTRAVAEAAGGRGRKVAGRRGRPPGSKNAAPKRSGRRHRAVITDAMRSEVKKLSEAGRTGAEIAKTVGVSLPSVQNIKKALGLVKARK